MDILLVAECSLADLQIPGVHISLVHKGASYTQLAQLITTDTVNITGFKILVIFLGRTDVLDRSKTVEESLDLVRQAVKDKDPAMILLVATPVPWSSDGAQVARKLFRTTQMLKAYCHGKATMEYLRASQEFVTIDNINPLFMNTQGITFEGLKKIRSLTLAKIKCSKLLQKYDELRSLGGAGEHM